MWTVAVMGTLAVLYFAGRAQGWKAIAERYQGDARHYELLLYAERAHSARLRQLIYESRGNVGTLDEADPSQ